MNKFTVPKKINSTLIAFVVIGAVSLAIGFAVDAHRAWAGLLATSFFLLGLSLFGGFFTALQFISGSRWSIVIRRVPESMFGFLPIALGFIAVILAGLLFHGHHLYHWADSQAVAHDTILQGKTWYLNVPFFVIRICIYAVIWLGIGLTLMKLSRKQDENKDAKTKKLLTKLSAAFMVTFALTLVFASTDLIMSVEPHWYSTMFPLYAFSGFAYSGVAALLILLVTIKHNNGLEKMNADHLHDVGKFQFLFVVFWAYIAFSQFMLIWYANMPEETQYLEARLKGNWSTFTTLFWVLHFVVPFFILLSREIKRDTKRIVKVAWFLLFMGFVDVIWMVYGGIYDTFHHKGFPFSWMELGLFLGSVGLFGIVVLKVFSKGEQMPVGDPDLEESLHFHQTH